MTILVTRRRVALTLALAAIITLLLLQRGGGAPAEATGGVPIWGACTGQKSGVIQSESTVKDHKGQLPISSLSHGITIPTDQSSGLPAGRAIHKPITFTMVVDRATPLLINSMVTDEALTACRFNFYRPAGRDRPVNYFRIDLTNAVVSDYKLNGNQSSQDTVTFSLVYQKIRWTYFGAGGSTTTEADATGPAPASAPR